MKNPPKYEEGTSYESWSKLIKIWQKLTDLPKAKQGPAVLLSLQGKPLEYVLELPIDDISKDSGFDEVLKKLDTLYKKDAVETAYEAYEKFEKFQRSSKMNITDYINEFEKLLNKTKLHGSVISSDILAYRLLNSANVSEDHRRLARATSVDLKYDTMKATLKKIFSGIDGSHGSQSDGAVVKMEDVNEVEVTDAEDVLYGWNVYSRNASSKFNSRPYNRGRGYGFRPSYQQTSSASAFKKKGKNPLDSKGNYTKCSICDSINHYASKCPDSTYFVAEDQEMMVEDHDVILFQSNLITQQDFGIFVAESATSAILDCGASATVVGKVWLDSYLNGLPSNMSNQVQYTESNNYFKFGSDQRFKSLFQVRLPAQIGSKRVLIVTDVVETSIPLLLSKAAMKKANTKINFTDDSVNMFGEKQPIKLTSSGHYAVSLNSNEKILKELETSKSVNITLHAEKMDSFSIATKLHSQFSHPTRDKLFKLVERAGLGNDSELLNNIKLVSESCKICKEFKKPVPRPSVGLPLASSFNEVVAMDLKFFEKSIILHLIDHVTRFSVAVIVKSKRPEDIIDGIFKCWITVFGPPKKFLTDNGGEFANAKFLELCEAMNIRVMTTAAESPWSNGIVERHNAVLAEMLHKTTAEGKYSLEVALCWVIHAKNSLANVHGFTPYQLTIGVTPKLPGILVDKPPALEEKDYQDLLLENLSAMKNARRAFIESESSERIKRALIHNIRPSSNNKFYIGDSVYYKRMDSRKWKGPGKVIGHDAQQILIKHGSIFVRVHPCRVLLDKRCTETTYEKIETETLSPENNEKKLVEENHQKKDDAYESDSDDGSCDSLGDESDEDEVKSAVIKPKQTESLSKTLKKGMKIDMKTKEGDWKIGEVMNRTGKATGKYKHFWDIRNISNDEILEYDMKSDVADWKEHVDDGEDTEEVNLHETLTSSMEEEITKAKEEELKRWKEEKVYDEVDDGGQFKISTRWVITSKIKNGKVFTKARLVARGYEEDGSKIRSDSPTCMRENIRIALCIVASKDWKLNSIDIKAAFLQGKRVSREINVTPPKEVRRKHVIWKLNKVVYGLVDASRNWYLKVKEELSKLGAIGSKYDKAVFLWRKERTLEGFVLIHVDDFLWSGTENFVTNVIIPFRRVFKISKEESDCFSYIGINIEQKQGDIKINQMQYRDSIKSVELTKEQLSNKDRVANEDEKKKFRAIVGQLGWISGMSRPDIAFGYCNLSTAQAKPKMSDFIHANKVIRDLKSRDVFLKFKALDLNTVRIAVFSDASYGNLTGGGSQIGYLIFLYDKNFSCAPLVWSSRKAKRVVRSTLSAETLAAMDALDATFIVRGMMEEFLGCETLAVDLFVDSKSLCDAAKTTNRLLDKRLLIDMAGIRELVETKEVIIKWIPTEYQLANSLTKFGASKKKLLEVLNTSQLDLKYN